MLAVGGMVSWRICASVAVRASSRRAGRLTLTERHVRLAGTEEDVADEHVARGPGFPVGARRQRVRPAGGQGGKRGAPASVPPARACALVSPSVTVTAAPGKVSP